MSVLNNITPMHVMAAVNRGGDRSRDWLAKWLELAIAAIPADVWPRYDQTGVNTPALITLVGLVTLSDDDNAKFRSALRVLRNSGRLDGYWTPHPEKKYMGHPIVVWHLPGHVPSVCKPASFPDLPDLG